MNSCTKCMYFKKDNSVCMKASSNKIDNPEKYDCNSFRKSQTITIIPRELKEGYTHCETCGGTGYIADNGYLERCKCLDGLVRFCDICGTPYKAGEYNCRLKSCKKIIEQKKLDKIIVLDINDEKVKNSGSFYCESYPYNEGYFDTIEDFMDYLDDENIELDYEDKNLFLYICDELKFELDIDSALERELEEHYEDAYDNLHHVQELRDFMDEWNKKQSVKTYYMNMKYRVDLRGYKGY